MLVLFVVFFCEVYEVHIYIHIFNKTFAENQEVTHTLFYYCYFSEPALTKTLKKYTTTITTLVIQINKKYRQKCLRYERIFPYG